MSSLKKKFLDLHARALKTLVLETHSPLMFGGEYKKMVADLSDIHIEYVEVTKEHEFSPNKYGNITTFTISYHYCENTYIITHNDSQRNVGYYKEPEVVTDVDDDPVFEELLIKLSLLL